MRDPPGDDPGEDGRHDSNKDEDSSSTTVPPTRRVSVHEGGSEESDNLFVVRVGEGRIISCTLLPSGTLVWKSPCKNNNKF